MSDSSDDEEDEEEEERPVRRISRSERAGVIFPVGKIERSLRTLVKERLSAGAAVYLAGVFQSLTAEIIERAGCIASLHDSSRIKPRHIMLASEGDEEFKKLLENVIFPTSGRPVGVLAPLHPPTSRLRLSKDRRQKLEKADMRKFKARIRSKNNNDDTEYDTDEYPPTSDIDEERYFPKNYKMSSPKPWPLPKRFSNIASIGTKSGYQFTSFNKRRIPSAPDEDMSQSGSPFSSTPPLPSPSSTNYTPPHTSTPDSASRWRRGSSLQRSKKTARKTRERSPSERGNSEAGSSSSHSDDDQDDRHSNKREKQKRKLNVYEFKTAERKRAPISLHPTGYRTRESDFEIGSHLRRSPVTDNDDYFHYDFGATGNDNNFDDDDEELPDLPFFKQSNGSRQKETSTEEKQKQTSVADQGRSPSIVNLDSSPSLPSTDRYDRDSSISSRSTKPRTTDKRRAFPVTNGHRGKSESRHVEDRQRRTRSRITGPFSRDVDKDTSDDSDIVSQLKETTISQHPLLPEGDKELSDASNDNAVMQKSPRDSFASDKLPVDSLAFGKKQLLHRSRSMANTRRASSVNPEESSSRRQMFGDFEEKSRKVKSHSGVIRQAKAITAKDLIDLYRRTSEAEIRRAYSGASSDIETSSRSNTRKFPKVCNPNLNRLNTPSVPEMDLSQTTQASTRSQSDIDELEEPSLNLSAENQALHKRRSRSTSQKSKHLPSSTLSRHESPFKQSPSDVPEVESDIMELDDPDTDCTIGDDEEEGKARNETDELDVDDGTARQPSPELEEQPPSNRRKPSRTDIIASVALLPLPSFRKSALSTLKGRSQSVRSRTGLENESQVEKALYEADSIASALGNAETMQSVDRSGLRSSLLDSTRLGSSNRPAAEVGSTRTRVLPSSLLPPLLPLDADSDIELVSSRLATRTATPPSHRRRSATRPRSRASVVTIPVVDPNIIDISSGEEEEPYLNTQDDVIFVKVERPDDPSTGDARSQTSAHEGINEFRSASSAHMGDKETQESVEL